MIAVNIGDLAEDKILAQFLVAPVVPSQTIVNCEPGRLDGGAVLLECEEERGEAIVWVIRKKHHKNKLRCYQKGKGKSWHRI